jgi:hypothetical protein
MLSTLLYLSQIIPPDNLHIGKIKKAIGKFLWSGFIYKIDRRQLCFAYQKKRRSCTNQRGAENESVIFEEQSF